MVTLNLNLQSQKPEPPWVVAVRAVGRGVQSNEMIR